MSLRERSPLGRVPQVMGYEMFPVEVGQAPFEHRMGSVRFPGVPMCPVCRRSFTTYLTLDLSDRRLGIDSDVPVLSVIYCHGCQTLVEPFFYQIGPGGQIRILQQFQGNTIEGWPTPRGAYAVELKPTPERMYELILRVSDGWAYCSDGLPLDDQIFLLDYTGAEKAFHQLGGPPFWIQRPVVLECPICTERMDFLLSLGSDDKLGWEFGPDVGRQYVFLCSGCTVIAAVVQST